MPTADHPADPTADQPANVPGVSGTPRRTPRVRRHSRRALLLAAGGLTLAGTMLVASLPSSGGASWQGAPGAGGVPVAHAPEGLDAAAEPEECEDGQLAAASWRPARTEGPAVRRIRERGRLIVGIDINSYRWGYRRPEDGKIVGFDIDLVRAIAEDLLGDPDRVTFRAIPTSKRIPALTSGELDMVVRTMSITCKRWQLVAFSTAYFQAGQQLLVSRASDISGFNESLAGARVCSAEGSTAQELLLKHDTGANLIFVPNHLDCLVLLQLGKADAVMNDSALAAGHAAQDPSMHLVGEPLTFEPYGVAMNLADVDLVRWVNAVLDDYRTADWLRSYDQWLAEYLPEDAPRTPPDPVYRD